MSNIDAVNALLTAINFDRFAEIEARHAPDVLFTSFRGPILRSSTEVGDWQRTFLRDYADCNYSDLEYVEQDDSVVVRATIDAKGYDWRPFTQRVIEVFRMSDEEVTERRLYGMLRNTELDKPANVAMENALGYRGGSAAATKTTVETAFKALLTGDLETAKALFHEKPVLIEGVYGLAAGFDNIAGLMAAIPRPAFGVAHVSAVYAADHTALVEVSIDASRPRAANWVRLVDGKIIIIETYWMLREIGVSPDQSYGGERFMKSPIQPI